uniref:Uncharacterized protein n=1 Tax=Candidatus Kentrum sp. TUN TaxID=2126343 RepID=A0A451ACZ0_9GAMM|nr:MAG: hypothetical protein BECKTUN1418D_GA0071000_12306 [Candidatus Kentron sp. TUN]
MTIEILITGPESSTAVLAEALDNYYRRHGITDICIHQGVEKPNGVLPPVEGFSGKRVLCVDCRHATAERRESLFSERLALCAHPHAADPVTGKPRYCYDVREENCGLGGLLFEPAETLTAREKPCRIRALSGAVGKMMEVDCPDFEEPVCRVCSALDDIAPT